MDNGNQVTARTDMQKRVGSPAAPMRWLRSLALAGMLAGCGTSAGQHGMPGRETAGPGAPERLPVIVYLRPVTGRERGRTLRPLLQRRNG